jgi:UrcA family protein
MTTLRTLAAVAALVLISGPALSKPIHADEDAPRQAAVSYADINLNTPEGQAIVAARIHSAAVAVCGPEPDSRDVKAQIPFRTCVKQSVDTAVAAIPSASQVAGGVKPAG